MKYIRSDFSDFFKYKKEKGAVVKPLLFVGQKKVLVNIVLVDDGNSWGRVLSHATKIDPPRPLIIPQYIVSMKII